MRRRTLSMFALTMLLAGEDTTAYTIAWAAHDLCEDARATAALTAEVDDVLGDARVPKDLEQAGLLPYASAVANESMRLRPVAGVRSAAVVAAGFTPCRKRTWPTCSAASVRSRISLRPSSALQ